MTRSRYFSFVEKTATLLLLFYPTFMLTVKGGMNGMFLLMLVLAFAVWIVRPAGIITVKWQYDWTSYFVAMAAMSAAIFISQTYHQNYAAHSYDEASRYWLAIPVFLLLQRLRLNVFTVLQFAFPVAAIIGLLLAKDMGGDAKGRMGIDTLDLIHFGDFELILGVLSLFSIDWFVRDRLPLRILKLSGFVAGLVASLASGSKGGWLAIPVFIAIFIYFKTNRIFTRMIMPTVIAATLTATLLYSVNANLYQRMNEFTNDVVKFYQGNRDTSAGIRWQLYKASVDVFLRHPIFGVGPDGLALEMKQMMEIGKITPKAAELGCAEVHNDILSKAARMGVFGLVAILAIYLVPLILFWRASKSAFEQVQRAGVLGIIFVSGLFVFGLTVEFLNLTMAVSFYSFTVAVLLAACYNIHHVK